MSMSYNEQNNINNSNEKDIAQLKAELETSALVNELVTSINTADNLGTALAETGKRLCSFLGAYSAFIYRKEDGYLSCWCFCSVHSETPERKPRITIPFSDFPEAFKVPPKGHSVFVSNTPRSREAVVLYGEDADNVKSFVTVPIVSTGNLIGFIGFDSPSLNITDAMAQTLSTLSTFVGTVILTKEEQKQLDFSRSRISENQHLQNEVFSSISCGVFAYEYPDYKLLAMNDEAKRIIGISEGDDYISAFSNFTREKIHPDDRRRISSIINRLKNVGDSMSFYYRVIVDGRTLHIKASVKHLVSAASHKKEFILCTLMDVTEQIRLTQSLEKEKKSYRDAICKNSEFSFLFDITEGTVNEEYVTAHGINLFEMFDLKPPVSFDKLQQLYKERSKIVFADDEMEKYFTCRGLIDAFEKGITNVFAEFYSPLSDMYIRANCLMSRDDDTGHIHGAVVAVDITDIRRKEQVQREALQRANNELYKANSEMNARIDTILNGISGGLRIIDVENSYKYRYISEGMAKLQGYTTDEFIDSFAHDVRSNLYGEEAEAIFNDAKRQFRENGSYQVKYRLKHKDGRTITVIERGKLVIEPGTKRKLCYSLLQDITELEERNTQVRNVLSMQEEMSECLSCGFFAYTIPGRKMLIFNGEAHRILGKLGINDENLQDELMNVIPREERPAVLSKIRNLKHPGDRVVYSFHPATVDMSYLALKCDTKLLTFTNGQKYILSSITDMTEQELYETRLDDERQQYLNALSYDSDIIFSVDLTDGIIRNTLISKHGSNMADTIGVRLPASYNEYAAVWLSPKRVVTDSEDIEILRNRDRLIESCNRGKNIIDFEYYITESKQYYRILTLLNKSRDRISATFIIYDVTLNRIEEKRKQAIISSLGNIYSALYHISLDENRFIVLKQHSDIGGRVHESGDYSDFENIYVNEFVEADFRKELTEFLSPANIKYALKDSEFTSIEFRRKEFDWCKITLVACSRDKSGEVSSVVLAGCVIEHRRQA